MAQTCADLSDHCLYRHWWLQWIWT